MATRIPPQIAEPADAFDERPRVDEEE